MSCWNRNGVLLLPGAQLTARLWLCESGLSVRIRGYCGPGSRQDDPASFIDTPTTTTIIITCVFTHFLLIIFTARGNPL